jgi:hypothetical protein
MGCFTLNIGQANAFQAELIGIMQAIELAHHHIWWNLWLETDSMMATLAYKSPSLIPWQLRIRWSNCMVLLKDMNFIMSHVYREGTSLADKLASMAFDSIGFTWFNSIPNPVLEIYNHNRLCLPCFWFSFA